MCSIIKFTVLIFAVFDVWIKSTNVFLLPLIKYSYYIPWTLHTISNCCRINANINKFPALVEKQTQLSEKIRTTFHLLNRLSRVCYNVVIRWDSDNMVSEDCWLAMKWDVKEQLDTIYYTVTSDNEWWVTRAAQLIWADRWAYRTSELI